MFQIKYLKTQWICCNGIDDDKSNYVYIKDFHRFGFHKTRYKNKKWLCRSCCENVLTKHKQNCLSINGKQSVN